MSYSGECHCGAVRFHVDDRPRWLTRCNCSICRRIGALWFHTSPTNVTITAAENALDPYTTGDKILAIMRCQKCGCTTHWTPLNGHDRMAVNMNMVDPKAFENVRIRHFDGADTWAFVD